MLKGGFNPYGKSFSKNLNKIKTFKKKHKSLSKNKINNIEKSIRPKKSKSSKSSKKSKKSRKSKKFRNSTIS